MVQHALVAAQEDLREGRGLLPTLRGGEGADAPDEDALEAVRGRLRREEVALPRADVGEVRVGPVEDVGVQQVGEGGIITGIDTPRDGAQVIDAAGQILLEVRRARVFSGKALGLDEAAGL